jgi:hypothetical protein
MNLLARLSLAAVSACALTAAAFAQEPQQELQQPSPQPVQQEQQAPVAHLQASSGAKLRALDKITGNSTDLTAKVGQTVAHGRIKVTVRACYQSSPQDAPESVAFLEIYAVPKEGQAAPKQVASTTATPMHKGPEPIGPNGLLFSGWMYASSPGLNGLEHPTYDVWVISCTTSAPQ